MKDTFYFKHEVNARSDSKLVKVQMKHGMVGIGIYWCIVEMLYENAGYIRPEYDRISFELRTDENVIRSVVEDFDLFCFDDEKVLSNSALKQINDRCEKSTSASNSVKKRWDKYERNTNVIPNKENVIQGEERRGEERIEKDNIKEDKYPFELFWNLYDKKVDRQSSERKYSKISQTEREKIFKHIPIYKKYQPDPQYRKNPDTYINNKSWNDELPQSKQPWSGPLGGQPI